MLSGLSDVYLIVFTSCMMGALLLLPVYYLLCVRLTSKNEKESEEGNSELDPEYSETELESESESESEKNNEIKNETKQENNKVITSMTTDEFKKNSQTSNFVKNLPRLII